MTYRTTKVSTFTLRFNLLLCIGLVSNITFAKCNMSDEFRLIKFAPTNLVIYLPKAATVKLESSISHNHSWIKYDVNYNGVNFVIQDLLGSREYYVDNPSWYMTFPALTNIDKETRIVKEYCTDMTCHYKVPLISSNVVNSDYNLMQITYSITEQQKNLAESFLHSLYIDDKKCKISRPDEDTRWVYVTRVQFPSNSAIIDSKYQMEISDFAKTANRNGKTKIKIRAWADEFETDSKTENKVFQQQLSNRRIKAFKTLLITKYGVDPEKFVVDESYGSSQPLSLSDTEEERQRNRYLSAEIY